MGAVLVGVWFTLATLAPLFFFHLSPPAMALACIGGFAVGYVVFCVVAMVLMSILWR